MELTFWLIRENSTSTNSHRTKIFHLRIFLKSQQKLKTTLHLESLIIIIFQSSLFNFLLAQAQRFLGTE